MSLKKNIYSNILLTSSTVVFPLLTFPYITRTLSSNSIGKFFFIDAFTQYFIIFSSIGIPFYGLREIAKVKDNPVQRSKLVFELVSIQVILAFIFLVFFLILSLFVPKLKADFKLVEMSCATILGTAFVMEWFYQGIENFTYITSRSLILKIISVISIFLFVRSSNDYLIYYLISVVLVLLNALLNFANYLKNYYVAFKEKINIIQHLKPLLVLFSINVSISVYTLLDTIVLGLFTDPQNVSYYNIPLKLAKMFWVVVNGVGIVLIPKVANLFVQNDIDGIQNILNKSLNIVFFLTIPFCFFCFIFPVEILVTISGYKYVAAANSLRILSIVPLVIGVCNVMGSQYLMPLGKEKYILRATIYGLVVSLFLNFLLIPHIKFIGASIACVIAESVVCIYIYISAKKTNIKLTVDYSLISQVVFSLGLSFISSIFLSKHLDNMFLLISVLSVYVLTFALTQMLYFKNHFIFSLIPFYNKSHG